MGAQNTASGTAAADGHGEPYYRHCILTFDAELPTEEVAAITIGSLTIPVER